MAPLVLPIKQRSFVPLLSSLTVGVCKQASFGQWTGRFNIPSCFLEFNCTGVVDTLRNTCCLFQVKTLGSSLVGLYALHLSKRHIQAMLQDMVNFSVDYIVVRCTLFCPVSYAADFLLALAIPQVSEPQFASYLVTVVSLQTFLILPVPVSIPEHFLLSLTSLTCSC